MFPADGMSPNPALRHLMTFWAAAGLMDTVFGPKAKDNEDARGMLNAGHRRGAVAGRCVMKGKTVETEELPAYCAVALAGSGNRS